jgi:hypothetical protein
MTNLDRKPAGSGSAARQLANIDAAPLAALGVPLLIGLFLTAGYGLLYGALPVLAIALLVIGAGEAWRRRTIPPSVAAGLVLLLIAAALLADQLIPWSDNSTGLGLPFGFPLGCAGLAGCAAAWRSMRSGGSGWFGSLLWVGGWVNLAGAALCVTADTSAGEANDGWAALGYLMAGGLFALVGFVLMLTAGIARTVRLRRSAGVRSSAGHPAGGW